MTDILPFLEVQHQGTPGVNLDTFQMDSAAPQDEAGDDFSQTPQFAVDNPDAFAVFERSAHDWQPNYKALTSTQASILLSGRVVGRKAITISVPTTFTPTTPPFTGVTPAGCIVGTSQGQVDAYNGFQLNSGDSITIATEGPVYVGPLPGASSTSYVQYIEEVNPPGGNLGSF